MISAVGPDAAIYVARYQLTGRTAWAAAGAFGFALTGVLAPMPRPLALVDVLFFGLGCAGLLAAALSRRTALRADASGITLGGPPARFWAPRTALFPWADIACVHLLVLGAGTRFDLPCLGIELKPGAAAAPRGYRAGRLSRALLGADIDAAHAIQAWRLDVGRLQDTMAALAPNVSLTSTMSREAAARTFSGARSPYRPSRGLRLVRFSWRYVAPLMFAALLADGVVHAVPALSAHFGGGRTGTFTVTRVQCTADGSDCTTWGRFVASGRAGGGSDVRGLIKMSPDTAVPGVGGRLTAVDTGDPEFVFPPGGAPAWWIYSGVVLVSGLLLALWALTTARVLLRRRRLRRPARAPALVFGREFNRAA